MEEARPGPPQVFVNLGATELPDDFVKHLVLGLTELGILNVFVDRDEWWGRALNHIFTCIEESTIALALFSSCYPKTEWCLDDLVKMKERADEKNLLVIPVFYNVSKNDVINLEGEFGDRFMEMRERYTIYDPLRVQRWETSVTSIARMEPGLTWKARSSNVPFVADILREVRRELDMVANPGKREMDMAADLGRTNRAMKDVYILAYFFIAPLVFTEVNFFKSKKWLIGFPLTIVALHQLYCTLKKLNRRSSVIV